MPNISDTLSPNGTHDIHAEIAIMQRRLGELIHLATRPQPAPEPKPDTRDVILHILKTEGHMTLNALQDRLKTSKSAAHHHVNALARAGRVVICRLPGTGGRLHNVVYHADAIAI